jgi:endonuclease YncB( thermonuclease family)
MQLLTKTGMRAVVPVLAALALVPAGSGRAVTSAVVSSVTDGDTVRLLDGRRVRLLQIDTPELGSGECYSRAARKALVRLVPPGSRVTLEADPPLDLVDRYGRLLRYLRRGGMNVNLQLVREGAAAPYFYAGARGRYATALLAAARSAKAARRGLWQACPHTVLDPEGPIETRSQRTTPPPALAPPGATGRCDRSYPGVCIPPPPPDLDCKDVPYKRFKVIPPDPHGFDGDRDGIGCET